MTIINADLVYAYNNLLPSSSKATSLKSRAASCSSISFYWALSTTAPALVAHNIFLADEYRESFDSIFKKQLIPSQPSFYVNVPSRIDPSASPAGTDSIVVLVPVGHLLDPIEGSGVAITSPQDWEAMVAKSRHTVLSTIKARTGADLGPHITHEAINTPTSWKEVFNLDKGAILGLSHSFFNVLSFRPGTKHTRYADLYFVGASTHPGTGVPICLAGSKIVAEQILADLRVGVPWRKKGRAKGEVKEIDRLQMGPVLSNVHVGLAVLVMVLLALLYRWGVF